MAIQANDITVKLTVQDDATSTLNRVQRELDQTGREGRQAFDKVDRSAEKAGRELRDFEGKADRTRLSVAKLATGLVAIGAAFEGIRRSVGAGLGFIQAASEFEEAAAKFGVVFGDEAQRVALEFEELSSVVRRSQVELVTAASSFQDLFVPMGLTRQQAADLSTEMVKLAVDVASFNNAQDADVIRNFQSALVGETEAVRKYGVLLDEARLKQLAYNNGIAEAGEELTQQQKVLARIIALYADTSDAQGDAARTADSFANTIKGIRGAAKDLEVVFGQELVAATREVLEELGGVEGATDLIKVAFAAASAVTETFIRVLGGVAGTAKEFIDNFGGADRLIAAFRGELEKTPQYAEAFQAALAEVPGVLLAGAEGLVRLAGEIGTTIGDALVGSFGFSIERGSALLAVKLRSKPFEEIADQAQRLIDDGSTALSVESFVRAVEAPLEGIDLTRARLEVANELGLLRDTITFDLDNYVEFLRQRGIDVSLEAGNILRFAEDVDPRKIQLAWSQIVQSVDADALRAALTEAARNAEDGIVEIDKAFIRLDELTGIDRGIRALEAVKDEIVQKIGDIGSAAGEAFTGEGRRIELRVSDFFETPETNEIVAFVTDFFSKVQQVQNQKAQELAAAFGINLFDLDEAAASGRAVEVVKKVAATLGAESEEPMSAAGRKAGLAFNRALAKAAEDFVPAEDPLLDFLGLSEQADQVATLNSILAGTFDEAAAQVQDYYDGLREAAIARANSSRESQELLRQELELLGLLEERDKAAVKAKGSKTRAIERVNKALNDEAIATNLVNGFQQQFEQLTAGLAQSFIDSEASFADFRDAFLKGILQMITQALILKALTAAFGGTPVGDLLGLEAPGAATGGVFTGVGSMAVGDAPGVTKGDGGRHGTFFFEKGGIMPGSMGLPVHQYATGGVARTPQLAVFGEGRGAEAFVPLPDGARIPVKMQGGAQDVTVNLSVQSLDPRGAADVVLAQMPLIRKEIAGALREGSDRTLLEGVRGASRR